MELHSEDVGDRSKATARRPSNKIGILCNLSSVLFDHSLVHEKDHAQLRSR